MNDTVEEYFKRAARRNRKAHTVVTQGEAGLVTVTQGEEGVVTQGEEGLVTQGEAGLVTQGEEGLVTQVHVSENCASSAEVYIHMYSTRTNRIQGDRLPGSGEGGGVMQRWMWMLNELCICFHKEALSHHTCQCSATGEEGVGHGSDGPSDGIYFLQSGTTEHFKAQAPGQAEREKCICLLPQWIACVQAPEGHQGTVHQGRASPSSSRPHTGSGGGQGYSHICHALRRNKCNPVTWPHSRIQEG